MCDKKVIKIEIPAEGKVKLRDMNRLVSYAREIGLIKNYTTFINKIRISFHTIDNDVDTTKALLTAKYNEIVSNVKKKKPIKYILVKDNI